MPKVSPCSAFSSVTISAWRRGFLSAFCLFFFCLLSNSLTASPSEAISLKHRSVTLALTTEPPKLNTLISSDAISFFVIDHISEGLTRYDANDKLVSGIAKSWNSEGNTLTFQLRKDARWQDGKPITAHDFVFAWQEVLKPKTGAPYAFLLYPIVNAEVINQGELPADKLGVKALSDHELEVTLVKPTPYFLDLLAFGTFRPVRQDALNKWGRAYMADADTTLSSGPFILKKWVHGANLTLTKNPHYWNAGNVYLDTIYIPYITGDASALFNLFLEEKIALWVKPALGPGSIKKALKEHLPLKKHDTGSVYFLEFNHRPHRITADKDLRKAIQLVIDVDVYTKKVLGNPGSTPAYSLFPPFLKGAARPFHEEYPPLEIRPDYNKAKAHLEQARKRLGIDKFPPLYFLLDDSGGTGGNKTGEYIQELLEETLGLEVRLDSQMFKLKIAKQRKGDFDFVLAGWGPDYNDPLTFADLLHSVNPNNSGAYQNIVYDKLIERVQDTDDAIKRAKLFGQMQHIIQDDVPLLPLYYRGDIYVQNPRLLHLGRRIFGGDPIFTDVQLAPEKESSP